MSVIDAKNICSLQKLICMPCAKITNTIMNYHAVAKTACGRLTGNNEISYGSPMHVHNHDKVSPVVLATIYRPRFNGEMVMQTRLVSLYWDKMKISHSSIYCIIIYSHSTIV